MKCNVHVMGWYLDEQGKRKTLAIGWYCQGILMIRQEHAETLDALYVPTLIPEIESSNIEITKLTIMPVK